jgi:hypothetical protein
MNFDKMVRVVAMSACIVLLGSVRGAAQFNDSVFHYFGIFSTGSLNTTDNNSAYLLNNTLKLGTQKKRLSCNAAAIYTFGEQNNKRTNNDITASVAANLTSSQARFSYWSQANYTSSYSLKINNQYQAGLGGVFTLLDKKAAKLTVSEGFLYESNDIFKNEADRVVYSTVRNSVKLELSANMKDRVSLNGNIFYQNSFNDGQDYILKSNLTLVMKLYKWINITAAYNYNRINITKRENVLVTYGITMERYF